MNDTSVRYVIGSSMRNVVRIDTAATSIGRNARNDAKTKSRTMSAPRAPSRVSPSTPGPPVSSPTARGSIPVTPTVAPSGAAACTDFWTVSVGSTSDTLCGNG